MDKFIFWLLTILCVWGKLTIGMPLRISPDEANWLDEEENASQYEASRAANNEDTGASRKLEHDENIRRLQGNRNR